MSRLTAAGFRLVVGLGFALLAIGASGRPSIPPDALFGVRLGMNDLEVRQALASKAKPDSTMQGRKQAWILKDRRFSHLMVRYDRGWRVQWVTAIVRKDGPRVGYHEIGDTSLARRTGRYFYSWPVQARGGRRAYTVTASGSDPARLHSVALAAFTPFARPDTTRPQPADSIR